MRKEFPCDDVLMVLIYLQLSLVPDESKRTKCKTETIPDSISPLFDEKFSL